MTEWFIADTHLRHKNILDFENRPFLDINEMEEQMIWAWNQVVAKNDTVYVVGDFCFGKEKEWIEILDQLKGEVVLIKGNHDHRKVIAKVLESGYLKEVYDVGKLIRMDKIELLLTHYPLETGERPNRFNISGHIHSNNNLFKDQFNVGVDSKFMHNYYKAYGKPFGTPISMEHLMNYVNTTNEELKEKYVRGN